MNYLIAVCLIHVLLVLQVDGKYRIFLEKVLTPYCDEEYTFSNGTTFKYNRTHIALNQTWIIYKQFPPELTINIQTYEFLNNEYRPFVINVTLLYCDYLKTHYNMFYKDFSRGESVPLPPRCPVLPGSYPIINFIPDNHNYPFNVPFNKLMLEFKHFLRGRLILHSQFYVRLDRDIVYREIYGSA